MGPFPTPLPVFKPFLYGPLRDFSKSILSGFPSGERERQCYEEYCFKEVQTAGIVAHIVGTLLEHFGVVLGRFFWAALCSSRVDRETGSFLLVK